MQLLGGEKNEVVIGPAASRAMGGVLGPCRASSQCVRFSDTYT